jgi:serine/threonine-protein kinase
MQGLSARLATALSGRYTIERELSRGGMAVVFLARDLRHRRSVAVKVLPPGQGAASYEPERFLREIEIAARLAHPGIVPLHDSGQCDGLLYFVMPFLDYDTLRTRLEREGPLPVADAVRIARQVAAALDFAHRQGVVHRDIKPENILLHEGGAVVADFGVARALWMAGTAETITERGLALGTPAYMSPEQASAEQEVDGRSDVYSLACVLYEMLAGRPPFAGGGARATILQHLSEPPDPVRAHRPDVPSAADHAVARALSKDPAERFDRAADFAEALRASASAPSRGAPVSRTARAIAVLPFVNVSADPDNEYLSDGLTDELIDALTRVEGLRVASRTSVFAFKGQPLDVRAIGARLGVTAVIEGSVRKAGSRLRIAARLTSVEDGKHLWSARYDRDLEDVFALEEEIAQSIVDTLRATLTGVGAPTAAKRYTDNVRAYSVYLKGRFCWNKRTQEGAAEAIRYFEQAIAEDPDYALAYTGLADAHALAIDYRGLPVTEGMERAKAYARQALGLDEALAEAHSSLAWVLFIHDFDWEGALEEFRRAIALDPRYATARQWYSMPLAAAGRFDESIREALTAVELDPASVALWRTAGWTYYYARRWEPAVTHLRRAIALNPTAEESHRVLGLVLGQMGSLSDAEAAFREALSISKETAYATAGLGDVLARQGREDEARALLAELRARADERYVSPVAFVMLHTALEEWDRAFEWLERAYAERRGWLAYLAVEPLCDPLRADPQFDEFLRKMRLPMEASVAER